MNCVQQMAAISHLLPNAFRGSATQLIVSVTNDKVAFNERAQIDN